MSASDVAAPVVKPTSPWVTVLVLMVLYTSSYIDRTVLGVLVGPIKKDLAISDTEFGILTGLAFVIFYTLAGIPLGWIVDRFNRRNLIVWGVAVWSVMTAACGGVNSYGGLFLARIGVGVGEATLSPATYSMISDTFTRTKLARALSIYSLGIPIGTALATLIGGAVVASVGAAEAVTAPLLGEIKPWQIVFLVVGLPGLLLALITALIVPEPPRREDHSKEKESGANLIHVFAVLIKDWRVYTPIFLGPALVNMFAYSVIIWYPAYLQRVHGFSIPESGIFLGLSTLVFGMMGNAFSGWLADWFVERGRGDGHVLVGAIYGFGIFICGALGPMISIVPISLFLASFTMFFSNTWNGVSAAALQIVTPNRMRGQLSAVWLFFTNFVVMSGGPLLVALITDKIFAREGAVGQSLALSALIAAATGCTVLLLGRKAVAARVAALTKEGA